MAVIGLVLGLTFLGTCLGQLSLVEDGTGGLQVYYENLLLIDHSSSIPSVTVGVGNATFDDDQGNFDIEDDVQSTFDLGTYSVDVQDPQQLQINFSNDVDSKYSVLVSMNTASTGADLTMTVSSGLETPSDVNRLWLRLYASVEEKVYGAGEQYTYFNMRGYDFPIWTREQGVGRDDSFIANVTNGAANAGGNYHTTYWPQSSFMSSRLYSSLIFNYNYMVLNFTDAAFHELYSHSRRLQLEYIFGNTSLEVVERVALRLGTQPPLPEWATTGAILGLQRGTDEVLGWYNLAKDAGVNITGLWVQDWSGTIETAFGHRVYWNWVWNETYYPGFDELVQDLAAEGVQVTVYCNPHLIEGSSLFEEGAALGHLLRNENGGVYLTDFGGFLGGTVDLLDAEASAWYRDTLRQNFMNLGANGWMADFGEYTGLDAVSRNPQLNPQEVHNLMPRAWAETNRDIVQTSGGALSSAVFWMRSGALGSSAEQVLAWAGDQNVDFSMGDGVASTIVAALSLAVSGMGLTHFDIGGYTTQAPLMVRTQELFLRSAEYAVFTPVMRTHEGNKPDSNHQFYSSNETLAQFARLTQMHSRLVPYTRAMMEENYLNGTPVQRPLFLHYEAEEETWDLQYQYLFGRDLLVAPVINKEAVNVTLYLPNDTWRHLLGMLPSSIVGPTYYTVDAPMGYPAVFYREASPWTDLFQSITEEYGP